MQLAAAGRIGATKNIVAVFWRNNVNSALECMGITIFKIYIWAGISSNIGSNITFTAPLARSSKSNFPTVYPRIYPPNENFEYSYPLLVTKFL